MKITLIIDFGGNDSLLTLIQNNSIMAILHQAKDFQKTNYLGEIELIFKQANLLPERLSAIIMVDGPGSFTGLRIAYSIVKTMAMEMKIPLTLIPRSFFYHAHLSPTLSILPNSSKTYFYHLLNKNKQIIDSGIIDREKINKEVINNGDNLSISLLKKKITTTVNESLFPPANQLSEQKLKEKLMQCYFNTKEYPDYQSSYDESYLLQQTIHYGRVFK